MASWHPIILEWTGPIPDASHLAALSAGLAALDTDAPELTAAGMETEWRSPTSAVDLQMIVGTLARLGFPARAQWAWTDGIGEFCPRELGWIEPDGSALDGLYEYHQFMLAYCWYFKYGEGSKVAKQAQGAGT